MKNTSGISKKLLIRESEMILIKNSETAKNTEIYGNLYQVIQPYNKFTQEDFYKNTLIDEKAKVVILNNMKMLIGDIIQEWSAIGYSDEAVGEEHCQLCHTLNKWVYYIKNKNNDNELHVGSDCIKKFPGIENVSTINRDYKQRNLIESEKKRRIQFETIDINDINYAKDIKEKFENLDIVLPIEFYNQIESTLYDFNFLKTNFIKSGGDLSKITTIYYELKAKLESLWNATLDYYNKNKTKRLICHKDEGDWLRKNNNDIWVEVARNNGFLTKETLKHLYYTNYVRNHLKDFTEHLSDGSIKITGIEGNFIKFYVFDDRYRYRVSFGISIMTFMKETG
jgi:hypothetical protein